VVRKYNRRDIKQFNKGVTAATPPAGGFGFFFYATRAVPINRFDVKLTISKSCNCRLIQDVTVEGYLFHAL
jgi:hypothetical protein